MEKRAWVPKMKHETRRQNLLSKREGTSKNSRRLPYMGRMEAERLFSYIQRIHIWFHNTINRLLIPYCRLTTDHRTSFRFGRFRHA